MLSSLSRASLTCPPRTLVSVSRRTRQVKLNLPQEIESVSVSQLISNPCTCTSVQHKSLRLHIFTHRWACRCGEREGMQMWRAGPGSDLLFREAQVGREAVKGFEGGAKGLELLVERQHRLRLLQDFRMVNLLVHTIPFQLLFQACYVLPPFKSARTHRPRITARTSLCAIDSIASSGVEHQHSVIAPACIGQISSRALPGLAIARIARQPRAVPAPGKPALP